MCNCGNKRSTLNSQPLSGQTAMIVNRQPLKMWPDISFEYIGNTGLTVKGNVTGKLYRYDKKGDTAFIDYRDASGMMRLSLLKRK